MKKLLKYMSEYKRETFLGPLFKLLEALFELAVPLVVAHIIDYSIEAEDKKSIGLFAGVLVLLGIVGFIFSVTAQFFASRVSVGFCANIRNVLFSHVQKLSFSQLDKVGISTLLTRMTSDINQVQTGVNLTLRLLLRSPFVIFGAAVMAYFVSASFTPIYLAVIGVLSVVVLVIMLITVPLHKSVQTKLDALTLISKENLSGVRVIRAFGREENEVSDFNEKNREFIVTQKKMGRFSALTGPITQAVVNVGIILLVYKGALSVNAGVLTQGALIALYNYMTQILVELIKLANLIVSISKALTCATRISDVLDIVPENTQGDKEISQDSVIVEFKNVSFTYPDASEKSLKDISFSVQSGQTVGILGGTGDGKTTLVNLIARFYPATSGEVLINGENVNNFAPSSLRENVGFVFQKAKLFSGTVRDNVAMGCESVTDEDVETALKLSQSYDFVMEKDGGINAVVLQGGKNFSGGQKQRLTIARALAKKPKILVLDDASSALDYLTESHLKKALSTLSFSPALFIVSQRASSVMWADLIVVLNDGEMVGCGKHDELLETCQVYREIYESQFGREGEDEE